MVQSTSGFLTAGNLAMEGGEGSPLEALKEEGQSGCVPPTSFEANSLKKRNWGLLFTGIVGGSLVAVYAVATPFVTPALRKICLPFVPATPKQIENVLTMLRCRRGSVVDIGSGDGRIVSDAVTCLGVGATIVEVSAEHFLGVVCKDMESKVIAAAKEGFMAVGYELNPWLVWYSRYRAWREGVHNSTKFYISDLWKVTFSQYTNIVIFGVPQMMPLLERKLELELGQDARVVACRFPFPHWTPDHVAGEGADTVWAYDAGSVRGRRRRAGPAGQSQ